MTSVSCLMVTQPGRLRLVADSVSCFRAQQHQDRELVIVHDGGRRFHRAVSRLVDDIQNTCLVRTGRAPLGELRNVAVQAASGTYVCQWDDDDLCHPRRLTEQLERLVERRADACFLTEQLHLFESTGEIFYDDWTVEPFPNCFIQGTLLARREAMPPYPATRLGEDTQLLGDLVNGGARITGLQGRGVLYVYRYTGDNAWDAEHHRAISRWKHVDDTRLTVLSDEITVGLAAMPIPRLEAHLVFATGHRPVAVGS